MKSTLTLVHAAELDAGFATLASPDGVFPLPRPYTCVFSEVHVADTHELLEVLTELGGMPDVCVIRAEPLDPDDDTPRRRLINPDKKTGDPATLRDVARDWVALTFDSNASPDRLRASLPHEFREAGCVWRASSAGSQLWFLLCTPVDSTQLRAWLRDSPVNVGALWCNTPQLTADPVFIGGVSDPMDARIGRLAGAERVVVPAPVVTLPDELERAERQLEAAAQAVREDPSRLASEIKKLPTVLPAEQVKEALLAALTQVLVPALASARAIDGKPQLHAV